MAPTPIGAQVRSFFFNQGVRHVSEEWLAAAIEWLQNEDPNLRGNEFAKEVFQLWLAADLRELETPSLPPGLFANSNSNTVRVLPSGATSYPLQILEWRDISQSGYSQLTKITGTTNSNTEVGENAFEKKIPSKRMLKFTFTDGVQTFAAIEYDPQSAVVVSELRPGTKILLKPTTGCVIRRGVLLLKAGSILRCFGGEVESLFEEHSQEAVLSRAIGAPAPVVNRQENIPVPRPAPEAPVQVPAAPAVESPVDAVDELFDDRDDFDASLLRQMEEECLDLEEEWAAVQPQVDVNPPPRNELRAQPDPGPPPAKRPCAESVANPPNIQPPKPPSPSSLSHVLAPTTPPGFYFVRAFISECLSKLTYESNLWRLLVCVNDGRTTAEVRLSNEFLAGVLKYTVSEAMNAMRGSPEERSRARSAYETCKDNLAKLDGVFQIEKTLSELILISVVPNV